MPSLWGTLQLFEEDDLHRLHRQCLRLLEEIGVGFHHREFPDHLQEAGADLNINFDIYTVEVSLNLIENSLHTACLVDRRHHPPQSRLQFSAEGGPTAAINLETGRRRPATLKDLADAVRLADTLLNIEGIGEPVTPADVPAGVWDLFMDRTMKSPAWSTVFSKASRSLTATIAFDVIREVGVGGVYLSHTHKAVEGRRNYWVPELFDRNTYDGWLARGGKDVIEIAAEKARSILATYHPRPLTDDQVAAMEDICKRARAELLTD